MNISGIIYQPRTNNSKETVQNIMFSFVISLYSSCHFMQKALFEEEKKKITKPKNVNLLFINARLAFMESSN